MSLFTTWLLAARPRISTGDRPLFVPQVLCLEDRVTPAAFNVSLQESEFGTPGDTDAEHYGSLFSSGSETVDSANPAAGVAAALTGTVTVRVGGTTTDYLFGPDTVGTSPADRKPFLVESIPGQPRMSIRFEDLANSADCDWDYNDRSWAVDSMAVSAEDQLLIDSGSVTLVNNLSKTATVAWGVRWTDTDLTEYRWRYDLRNNNLPGDGQGVGVYGFELRRAYQPLVYSLTTDTDWPVSSTSASWVADSDSTVLLAGETGRFEFKTAPSWIVLGPAAARASTYAHTEHMPQPGAIDPKADIIIDGKVDGKAFSHTTEDTIGGLVVRRIDDNKAPRQQITIEKLVDPAKQPVPGGKVEFTFDGKVEIYDANEGGAKVTTGKKYDNAELPKKLWVQGLTGSGKMRDVPLTAKPVVGGAGVEQGKDDVAFTVLWVDVTARFASTDDVSLTNDKRDQHKDIKLPAPGDFKLGRMRVRQGPQGMDPAQSYAYETVGVVSPKDFSYPGSDLTLSKDVKDAIFVNNQYDADASRPKHGPESMPAIALPPGNDYDPDNDSWIDATLDKDGKIFALDHPGFLEAGPAQGYPVGITIRARYEFLLFSMITIDGKLVRSSGKYMLFVALSGKQVAANTWAALNDVPGDNSAKFGEGKFTWNLT